MTTVTEAVTAKPPLGGELASGLDVLSAGQAITFQLYKKMVLPLDGFLFWINYSLVTPNAGDPPTTTTIQGSLHYSTDLEQEEDATISANTIVFTALTQCDLFQQIDPQFLYLANYNGIRFSFSSQGKYYQQADLWHYIGLAVTSRIGTQIVDTQQQLNSLSLVVSNSLPIWLAMPSYVPPYPGFTCPIANIYPSYLVPENEPPPYASVHIEETTSLVADAFLSKTLTSKQLTSENVRVTMYGVNNDTAITFLNFVNQYSYDWNYIGLMNMPIVRDEKLVAPEIQAIAQKKVIDFKISYLQTSVRNVARQLILKSNVQYPGVTPPNNTYFVVPSATPINIYSSMPDVVQSTGLFVVPSSNLTLSSTQPLVYVPTSLSPNSTSTNLSITTPNITVTNSFWNTPASYSFTLTATQPIIFRQFNISPPSSSLATSLVAPNIHWTNSVSTIPGSASIVISSVQPIVSIGTVLRPSSSSIALSTTSPNIVQTTNAAPIPASRSLTLTSTQPIVLISNTLNYYPTAATLITIPTLPNIIWTNNVWVVPVVNSLSLTPTTPNVAITESVWLVPGATSAALSSTQPLIYKSTTLSPNANSITLVPTTPNIVWTNKVSVVPSSNSISLASTAPTITHGTLLAPATMSLTLAATTPGIGTQVPYQLDMITPIVGGLN